MGFLGHEFRKKGYIDVLELLLLHINGFVNMLVLWHLIGENLVPDEMAYDMIEMLLPHVKSINKTQNGFTLLKYASDKKKHDIVELLIENGARD